MQMRLQSCKFNAMCDRMDCFHTALRLGIKIVTLSDIFCPSVLTAIGSACIGNKQNDKRTYEKNWIESI